MLGNYAKALTMKVGLGGSCHWCTEAVFQSLLGVGKVEQGWIAALAPDDGLSEAVIVHFDETKIALRALIAVHLHTHSCTAQHSMREKYRSAVYVCGNTPQTDTQQQECWAILAALQAEFSLPLVTRVLVFNQFKPSAERYQNYYKTDPSRPFCQNIIAPKLRKLQLKFATLSNPTH